MGDSGDESDVILILQCLVILLLLIVASHDITFIEEITKCTFPGPTTQ